jgi:hypothetical protein
MDTPLARSRRCTYKFKEIVKGRKRMEKGKLTRRDFLNLSAMTAAGAALAACAPTATPEGPSEEMPQEEVVVNFWSDLVGSKEEGRAALIAAYNAANLAVCRREGFPSNTIGGRIAVI